MKLYVENKNKQKAYLSLVASSKLELFHKLGSFKFILGDEEYTIDKVKAEPDSDASITGGVSGGLVGILGGPIGILLGLGIGLLIGSGIQSEENSEINHFNESAFNPDSINGNSITKE